MPLTDIELKYLGSQRLGRLATVDAKGAPQNNPVGFRVNTELGTIDIGGFNLGKSRKFTNIQSNPQVAFVVDDLVSVQPWQVRGIEIRGRAEALTGLSPEQAQFGAELIRIYPRRIVSWGLDPAEPSMHARTVNRPAS